jgi:hypothetical protein
MPGSVSSKTHKSRRAAHYNGLHAVEELLSCYIRLESVLHIVRGLSVALRSLRELSDLQKRGAQISKVDPSMNGDRQLKKHSNGQHHISNGGVYSLHHESVWTEEQGSSKIKL